MKHNDQARIITFMAAAPPDLKDAAENPFLRGVIKTLSSCPGHQSVRVSSVRDLDLELCKVLNGKARVRVQIIGHSMSGMLALGAHWLPEQEFHLRAFRFPYYVLDTTPSALGLLSKHAGKLAEVMLVGCNIGSSTSFGYAINGRTLTYTLTELLRCSVRGADDVVAPDEFDARGWYAPRPNRRSPKGWQWVDDAAPVWIEHSAASTRVA
jgi:hypothetical protein